MASLFNVGAFDSDVGRQPQMNWLLVTPLWRYHRYRMCTHGVQPVLLSLGCLVSGTFLKEQSSPL